MALKHYNKLYNIIIENKIDNYVKDFKQNINKLEVDDNLNKIVDRLEYLSYLLAFTNNEIKKGRIFNLTNYLHSEIKTQKEIRSYDYFMFYLECFYNILRTPKRKCKENRFNYKEYLIKLESEIKLMCSILKEKLDKQNV